MKINIEQVMGLMRPYLRDLKPYSSARDEFDSSTSAGQSWVYLDANENPNPTAYNRYPDPHQRKLKESISRIKSTPINTIFLGNGSDEAIDLVIRMFCTPGYHNIVIPSPTYGMYKVSADINNVSVKTVSLTTDFDLDAEATMKAVDDRTRIIFLCSPNNPSGNLLSMASIDQILTRFEGIVVVDEAYIDFAGSESLIMQLSGHPNLIVLQTLSKAWGLAGLRLGMAFANPSIVAILDRIKPPYNISSQAQQIALSILGDPSSKDRAVSVILAERSRVAEELDNIKLVEHVYPSSSNFLLIRVTGASEIYNKLIGKNIVVRNRSGVLLCDNCLRITIGTRDENDHLLNAFSTL